MFRIRARRVEEEFNNAQIPNALVVAADPSGGVWLGLVNGIAHYRNGKLD